MLHRPPHAQSFRPSTLRWFLLWGIAIVCTSAVAACGSSADRSPGAGAPATENSTSGFPVSIPNMFGTTTIEKRPERIVTLGIGSDDALLAMGVTPVAMSFATYGADAQGLHPWTKDQLTAMGVPTPTILPDSQDPPYEQIISEKPDLILATYSGITQRDYDLLSKIAPTVASPEGPWTSSWRDVVTTAGVAIGEPDAAAKVLNDVDADIAAAARTHPELSGKTVAFAQDYSGTFSVYDDSDPRVQFAQDIGMVSAPAVSALDTDSSSTTFALSYERLGELKSDVLVSFAETQKDQDDFLNAEYAQLMPQVENGAVAKIVGPELIAAVAPPTALSLPWVLEDYVAALSIAAHKAR